MILVKTRKDLQEILKKQIEINKTIGFVPTMGALHEGHISLIKKSLSRTDYTACSIFVNPTQFNNKLDFEKYPSNIENDILLLEKAGCNVLFLPSVNEIYPLNSDLPKTYNLGFIESILEGEYRPGHFQGVCQVVHRLLNAVSCNFLFLGQKDYQQCMVLKKMIELTKFKCEIIIAETIRSEQGLALSSRNLRIPESKKENALGIYKTLQFVKENFKKEPFDLIINRSKEMLFEFGFSKVDYVAICNTSNLETEKEYNPNIEYVCLIATFLDDIRLIDNLILKDIS